LEDYWIFIAVEPGVNGNGGHVRIGLYDGKNLTWFGFYDIGGGRGAVKIEKDPPSPKATIIGRRVTKKEYLAAKKAIHTRRFDGAEYDLQYGNCASFVWEVLVASGLVPGEEEHSARTGPEILGGLNHWTKDTSAWGNGWGKNFDRLKGGPTRRGGSSSSGSSNSSSSSSRPGGPLSGSLSAPDEWD
jgi:hypothetical protein